MELKDKIFYCRKKQGLSQEELAEKIGVSRQAVSKWETGEAVPETNKLLPLAQSLAVTVDWLLRDDLTEVDLVQAQKEKPDWAEAVPGLIGRLLRSYGWLAGVYIAIFGAGATAIGATGRRVARMMLTGFPSGGPMFFDSRGRMLADPFSPTASKDPFSLIATLIMGIGIVALVGGIVLALALRRWGKADKKR